MKLLAALLSVAAVTSAKPFSYGYTAAYPYATYPYSYGYGAYPYAYPQFAAAAPAATVKTAEVQAFAAPVAAPYIPAVYAPAYSASQYHAQDELGQASYGYAHPGQSHAAQRDAFGNVVGSYAYINPDGKQVQVNYIADANGFRVASNDLPVAPSAPAYELPVAPKPVEDTAEVKAAKEEHFAAVAKARALALESGDGQETSSRRKRSVVYTHGPAFPYAAFPHSYRYATPFAYAAPSAYAAPFAYATPAAYAALVAYTAPVAYAAAPVVPAHAVREATLTKTVLNPGHAVSYRVD